MQLSNQPEVWLRGPIPEISALLQPAAHALLQTSEELRKWLDGFEDEKLWLKPAGRANVGFHLQHMTGVLDRMMTYAKEQGLSKEQFDYLELEGVADERIELKALIKTFEEQVAEALSYFKTLTPEVLLQTRKVGRKELPSTTLGLLFHAAEHSQRHLGQLLVTVSVLSLKS